MFGIGTEEIVVILLIAFLVLGPERTPKLARDLGRMIGDLRKASDELRNEFVNADILAIERAKAAEPAFDRELREAKIRVEAAAALDAATPITPYVPPVPVEPEENAFDKELREARERMRTTMESGT